MVEKNAPWLVKCGDRILGPMEASDVTALLKSREIHVLDEVAQPLRRWLSIQEIEAFREAVLELRSAGHPTQSDNTTGVSSGTISVTAPVDGEPGRLDDDLTPGPGSLSEIVYEDIREKQQVTKSTATTTSNSYGLANSVTVLEEARSTTRLVWWAVVAIAVLAGGFFTYQEFFKAPHQLEANLQNDFERGMLALDAGDYATALDRFSRFNEAHPEDDRVYLYLGPLLIQVESQTVRGKQLLNKAIEHNPKVAREAWTGIGVAEMIDGHLDLASDAFHKSLEQDAEYFPALIDLGILQMQRQQYSKAKATFESVINRSDGEAAAFLLYAETLIDLYQQDHDRNNLAEGLRALTDFLRNATDYAQEAEFIALYTEVLKGDTTKALQRVDKVLDWDPQLTDDHRHNIFIYSRRLSWGSWVRWCEQSQAALGVSPSSTALWAFCLYRSDRALEARKMIENAVAQSPKDSLIQAIYSFILHSSSLEDGASVALGKALEADPSGSYQLPLMLQAQFCDRQKDLECSQKYWKQLIAKNPNNLTAIAGLAQAALDAGDTAQLTSQLARGLTLSPDYKPLRRLMQRAQAAGIKVLK
jgi:tetratricopeptide (TPR) repeat protein